MTELKMKNPNILLCVFFFLFSPGCSPCSRTRRCLCFCFWTILCAFVLFEYFCWAHQRRPFTGVTGAAANQAHTHHEATDTWATSCHLPALSPGQVQSLQAGSATPEVRAEAEGGQLGGRVRRLPQNVVFGLQLVQVVSGEVGSPGSTAIRPSLLPQLLHLDRNTGNDSVF